MNESLHQTEDRVQEHEREHKFAVDATPALVWTAQPDGYCDFLNLRWREYTGLTFEEAKGGGWQRAIYPEYLAWLLGVWRAVLASGKPRVLESGL